MASRSVRLEMQERAARQARRQRRARSAEPPDWTAKAGSLRRSSASDHRYWSGGSLPL